LTEKGHKRSATRERGTGRRPSPTTEFKKPPVWLFTAILSAVGAGMFVVHVAGLERFEAPVYIPWWGLAILFYVTETTVVRIGFRSDQYWFSLSEIPLVLGLFFTSPIEFVVAQVVGASAALAFNRKQSRLKVAFNSANYFLGAVAATSVFHSIAGMSEPTGPTGWVAAYVAVTIASLIAVPAIFIAISLNDGAAQPKRFVRMLATGLFVSLINATVGLVGVVLIWRNPLTAWVLLVPTATVFVAYRAFSAERQKRETLDFLYRTSRIFQESKEVDDALVTLLEDAQEAFSGAEAEVLFLPSTEEGIALRTSVSVERDAEVMAPIDAGALGIQEELTEFEAPTFLDALDAGSELARYFGGRGFRNAMVAPLHGETRGFGVMVIANQIGDVGRFDPQELKLFETLANQTSISLENGRLEKSLAQLNELKEELDHQATHDPLTGLANRVLFKTRIEAAIERSGERVAVLFLDLDDFKTVNDSLGHASGDSLLVAVAERLNRCLREEDTAARLGGDEFGLLVDDLSDIQDAIYVAERVTRTLAAPFSLGGKEVFVHASVGIAFGEAGATADTLLRNGDVAMYRAKARGKGIYEVYESSMHAAVVERMELKAELERSVADNRFLVLYQPVVSLVTGQIIAAEALVRWNHPERGILPPSEFVSLAEETGLIVPISRWVIGEACAQVDKWRTAHPTRPAPVVAVNLSPRHIHQLDFVDDVVAALRAARIEPSQLAVELTENVLMADLEDTLDKLSELKTLGVRVALDDFGSGFSSLGNLRTFPLDMLKIPKPFLDDLSSGRDSELIDAMIKLGRALGLSVVAEGIEDRKQFDLLRSLGCDEGQGYFFSGPVPADEFGRMLEGPAFPSERGGGRTVTLPA
jgi:diguanylate cyclase (GGDEF)-like protein